MCEKNSHSKNANKNGKYPFDSTKTHNKKRRFDKTKTQQKTKRDDGN